LIKKAVTSFDSLDFAANNLKIEKANAIVFCRGDEYKPLKVLAKFNKKNNFIKKRFKYGFYENGLINANELEKLSKLPSKEVLINNLCYYLNFQVIRLTNVLEKIEK
jgi:ribosomal protein L10